MKRIITIISISLILVTIFAPISFAGSWKLILTDPKDSKMEADIESISFKEDEQFFYIKFESYTNWNLYDQNGALVMYFDMKSGNQYGDATNILIVTEYKPGEYACGFYDIKTDKTTQCETDFKRSVSTGVVKIPLDAMRNRFVKFSFLCVLGSTVKNKFVGFDYCPDIGKGMEKFRSRNCPAKPSLEVNKTTIELGNSRNNKILSDKFELFNNGEGSLDVDIKTSANFIKVEPSKFSVKEFDFENVNVEVNLQGLPPNEYQEKITINSNGGNSTIVVIFEVLKKPELYFDPIEIDFGTVAIGEKKVQVVKIGNKNKGPIKVRLVTDVNWITFSKIDFENDSEEIKLTTNTKKLSPGEYSGKLKIFSNGGNGEISLKIKVIYPFSLNKELIDFGKIFSNNLATEPQTIVLKNNLDYSIIVETDIDVTWIKIKETKFEVLSKEEKKIEISVDLSQIGNNYKVYTGKITFSALDLKIDLKIQIEIVEAPPKLLATIEGNAKAIEGEVVIGEKFEKKIIIKNTGGGILKGKAYILEKNSPIKLSEINFIIKSGVENELLLSLDSSNLKPCMVNNTLILDSNGGKVEIPISIKVNPKPPIIITLKIGSTEAYAGGKIVILDAPPYIKKGTTFVPLRFISEAFGAKVEWQNIGKGRVLIKFKDKEIILDIGSTNAFINNKLYTLLAPPEIVNGRTFVPVRFISEGLGAKVKWIAQTQEVVITLDQ